VFDGVIKVRCDCIKLAAKIIEVLLSYLSFDDPGTGYHRNRNG